MKNNSLLKKKRYCSWVNTRSLIGTLKFHKLKKVYSVLFFILPNLYLVFVGYFLFKVYFQDI